MSKKLYIETYGCQMNVADSEVVASVMQMAGYEPTDTEEDADAVFLNTCSVRENAENKIYHRTITPISCVVLTAISICPRWWQP